MGLIREELYKVEKNWNLHKIRPSNADTPHFSPRGGGGYRFQKGR